MNPVMARALGAQNHQKPSILFVDDEKRVLNSMRAMFRRDYDLFLTTRGDEALRIINENNIDVVVADQRMPKMTGVEVLTAVRKQSPATVRILLTGYADLDAIEGAMNDSEVFRFLSKPCAAEELRGTIRQATEIARETAGTVMCDIDTTADETSIANLAEQGLHDDIASQLEVLVEGDTFDITSVSTSGDADTTGPRGPLPAVNSSAPAPRADVTAEQSDTESPGHSREAQKVVRDDSEHSAEDASPDLSTAAGTVKLPTLSSAVAPGQIVRSKRQRKIKVVGTGKYKVSVIVFSSDEQFARIVGRSLQDHFYTFHASNIAHLMHGIRRVAPAVLITDISEDPEVINQLTANLKQVVPELVTLVASSHRDADLMVGLINFGQVYRFIDKPLSSTACKRHVRAAIRKHIQLRDNPELIQRHQVVQPPQKTTLPASVTRLFSGLGRVREFWAGRRRN